MPDILRKSLLAAVIALGAAPAWGAGMPEYGTKNFTPGADAPSYFTNETGALGVAADFGSDPRAAAPSPAVRAESGPRRAATTSVHRHPASAASRHGGRRVASQAHGHGRTSQPPATHAHGRSPRTTQAHTRGGSLHMASAKEQRGAAARRPAAGGRSARAAKSNRPGHGKAGVRHAAAPPASRKG